MKADLPFFVINPISGGKRARSLWPKLSSRLESLFGPLHSAQTSKPQEAGLLARQAIENGYHWIVSVGGDGTLHEVVNGIFSLPASARSRVRLSILPMGSGDDFAKSLSLPPDPLQLIERWKKPQAIQIDIGKTTYLKESQAQNQYFINIADLGMGGEVMIRVNRSSKLLGYKFTYVSAIVQTLAQYKPYALRIETESEALEADNLLIALVANGRYFGNGLHMAPQASLSDGKFEIVLIEKFGIVKFLKFLPKLYGGKIHEAREVKTLRGSRIRITPLSPKPVLMETDGELLGPIPAEFEVLPQALEILF